MRQRTKVRESGWNVRKRPNVLLVHSSSIVEHSGVDWMKRNAGKLALAGRHGEANLTPDYAHRLRTDELPD